MNFKEDLQKLSGQVVERMQHITNEEMTKQALIIPLFQVLGYDVFNPLEVMPEYVADIGRKKGEKVDYAIFKDGMPILFVEAKPVNDDLTRHSAQLARYFNATPDVRFAILTNGIQYKFFTDLNKNNVMDDNSFIKLNITCLKDIDIEILSRFRKCNFITDELLNYASEIIYTSSINKKLNEIFKNPPDEFIRYLIKDFSDTRITTNVIERFRPIVKKSISLALLDIVSQGILKEEANEVNNEAAATSEDVFEEKTENNGSTRRKREIITTEDELKSYEMIRELLEHAGKDISGVNYKDTTIYFGIYNNNVTNWFIRLNLDSANKHIITKLPLEKAEQLAGGFKVEPAQKGNGESRIFIEEIENIKELSQLIIECYNGTIA